MVLHPIKLPKSATLLFRVVVLQKRLLQALSKPSPQPIVADETWLQQVWSIQPAQWVQKFCRGGKRSVLRSLQAIAAAPVATRMALYTEFQRQNKLRKIIENGGTIQNLGTLNGFDRQLAAEVTTLFTRCYELLSHDTKAKWNGYEIGRHTIANQIYKLDICADYPARSVCPYCDDSIGTPVLDHYFPKSLLPLLACCPWNLVPVCESCNRVGSGKGNNLPIVAGSPVDWLHPFFRPASKSVHIRLTGKPMDSIPRLYSPDAGEQTRLDNHFALIPSLGSRWTNTVAAFYERLVGEFRRNGSVGAEDTFVKKRLADSVAVRGRSPSSMVHAAVCQAVLDRRQGYIDEFASPNAPQLS